MAQHTAVANRLHRTTWQPVWATDTFHFRQGHVHDEIAVRSCDARPGPSARLRKRSTCWDTRTSHSGSTPGPATRGPRPPSCNTVLNHVEDDEAPPGNRGRCCFLAAVAKAHAHGVPVEQGASFDEHAPGHR
ncbi:hypothetical protein, partial [Saccharothrix sp. Mg75]|uniref:hypothetical protein n=1 Tax=Saccharothrix sp. Mg75 TaxID=3445357 RepID=UPI003EE9F092